MSERELPALIRCNDEVDEIALDIILASWSDNLCNNEDLLINVAHKQNNESI